MTPEKLLAHCLGLGIRLFAGSGQLGIDAPGCAPSPWLAEQLSNNRAALLALIISREQDAAREARHRGVRTPSRFAKGGFAVLWR